MSFPRRKFLQLAAGASALPAWSHVATAQTYPARPVRVIVGFATGGPTDLFTRLITHWLSEQLGQQFIVENRAGGGSNIATEAAVRASPDGYTLLAVTIANALNATLYDNLGFNFLSDIAPVAGNNRGPGVLVVLPSFPAETVPGLIAHAKARPGEITYASAGIGSSSHLYGELFKAMSGTDLVHVPYRGAGPALLDLLAGQVGAMFDTVATSIEHIRSGKLRPLAVTTEVRSEALPGVPIMADFLPGYSASGWNGFGAPRNTPPEIIARLNKEINAGLTDPKIKARFAELSQMPIVLTPAEFGRFMADETEKWRNR